MSFLPSSHFSLKKENISAKILTVVNCEGGNTDNCYFLLCIYPIYFIFLKIEDTFLRRNLPKITHLESNQLRFKHITLWQ